MSAPIILGAGPAGCMAATLLAQAGADPVLIDRQETVGDALCGGFMSWRTAGSLRRIAIDPDDLGAHRVDRLALFTGNRIAHADLPERAYGLSRHALDTAMRQVAVDSGAQLRIDRARHVEAGVITGESREWRSDTIFLTTGKHDVRGLPRPRIGSDPSLGIRIRIPAQTALAELIGNAIELHFFAGGYAGIVLQEDGTANVCMAVRKSMLSEVGGDPRVLLDELAIRHPAFGERMRFADSHLPVDTIGAVPYGWIAHDTHRGLYRLGDQAAVIPSLAGEGMAIALASAQAAADRYLRDGADGAQTYQRDFAKRALRPVTVAKTIWKTAGSRSGGHLLTEAAKIAPPLASLAMRLSRI